MSNLRGYQTLTTVAKKVGGPTQLVLLIGVVGAATYKGGELFVKKCVKAIKAHRVNKTAAEIYSVVSPGESNEGLMLEIGDHIRVLDTDGDAVMIEKIGDSNNPYFISRVLLCTITNYNK